LKKLKDRGQAGEEEIELENKYYDDLKVFFQYIADNIDIVDPVERPAYFDRKDEEGLDDAMRVSELREALHDLQGIGNSKLSTPLTNTAFHMVEKMFQEEFKHCLEAANDFLKQAKEKGKDFKGKLL
jgi:hypothetical protein